MNANRFTFFFFVLTLLAVPAQGQDNQKFAQFESCTLENGEKIHPCKIGYREFGKLNAEKSNAVLFPAWFGGTSRDLEGHIGPGKLVDTNRYYVIAVDPFGNSVSSSPSNSPTQKGNVFPEFSLRDNVVAQHRLVQEHLGLDSLYGVIGISMGGMQAFEWMASYPTFMHKLISIVGTPRLSRQDQLLWQAELNAIESAAPGKQGIQEAMETVALIHAMNLTTPEHLDSLEEESFNQFVDDQVTGIQQHDPLDWASQLRAMLSHDIYENENEGDAVEGPEVLIIVDSWDQMVNPEPALELAEELGVEAEEYTGECGHLIFDCHGDEIIEYVHDFLGE